MNAFELLLSTSALLAVPVIAHRCRIQPRPVALATIWAVALAALVVLTTLSMCALALVGTFGFGDGDGIGARHLVPAVPFTGWISLVIISVALASGARAIFTTMRRRRALTEHLRFVPMTHVDDVAVATLPVEEFIAVAVPGPHGCVVMSRGAMERLSPPELLAVVRHEEAHRRLGHHRHLTLARAMDRSLWFIPGMRHATRTLRDVLEIAADDDARRLVPAFDLRGALGCGVSQPDHGTTRRIRRLDPAATRRYGVAGLVLSVIAVSAMTVVLELSWLGVVA